MSVRNLNKLFKPRSVALVGSTSRPCAVGAVVARNLRRADFGGELMLVNPHHQTIEGPKVYPTVADLPQPPELAVIVTPPDTVPRLGSTTAFFHPGARPYPHGRRKIIAARDYDREMALLGERDGTALGVAYFFADPDAPN